MPFQQGSDPRAGCSARKTAAASAAFALAAKAAARFTTTAATATATVATATASVTTAEQVHRCHGRVGLTACATT